VIVRGRIRGNGAQLANYLLTLGENTNVQVFNIRGTSQPFDLRKSLLEMSLTSELSGRTHAGLYHVQICPRPGEDRQMTRQDWLRAAEIMEKAKPGLTGQKRIMVMHEKDGRLHMHVAWERWDHEKGKMISNRRSRLAQDRARKMMEIEFQHLRTPDANLDRPALRTLLNDVLKGRPTGQEFVSVMAQQGYTVARTTDRRPFAIVSAGGVAFDLVREAKARTKTIRELLKDVRLPEKKQVIKAIRVHDRENRSERELKRATLKKQLQRDRTNDRGR